MLEFGKYKLVQPLGKGGMAQVWLAHKPSVAGAVKVCAVKFPRDIFSDDENEREALLREGRVAMLLNHSNIVQVNDLGFVGALPYIELERIDGIDLSALNEQMRLFGMPFSFSLAAYILQEILEALAYAHTFSIDGKPQHIVHRDVSPHNVLCSTAGEVKLMDFGIAAAASEHSSGNHARGKLRYMAPEHLAARAVAQSDLFAAGAIFWELIEGKKFRHETPIEDMRFAVLKHDVPAFTRADVPRELVRLTRELLEPDLKKRVATADEALKLLRLWPASTSERAGLRALLAQHRVTRRSGMTHADIAVPPWLAAALAEINVHAGGTPVSLPVAPVRESDSNAAPSTGPREDGAPQVLRKRSSPVLPVVQPPGDLPATERTSRLGHEDPARGDRTVLLDHPDLARASGLRGSGTDPAPGQSAPGPRDSSALQPMMASSSSRLSADAETATATAMSLPDPPRRGMWIGLAVFVVVVASAAAYGAKTFLGSAKPTEVASVVPTETPKPASSDAEVDLPPEPRGPVLAAPPVVAPEITKAEPEPPPADPVPADPPQVAPTPIAEPTTPPVAPAKTPVSAPKPKVAKKDVTLRLRLMNVDYGELKLGNKTIVVDPSADLTVSAGKHSVKWRAGKTDPWQSAPALDLGEGLEHVVRIGSKGPTHASSPEDK